MGAAACIALHTHLGMDVTLHCHGLLNLQSQLRQQVTQLVMLLQEWQHLVLQAVALVQLEGGFEVQLAKLRRQFQPAALWPPRHLSDTVWEGSAGLLL